jgi:hypothetical protein
MAYVAQPLDLDTQRDSLTALWEENLSDPGIAAAKERRVTWLYRENPAGGSRTFLVNDDKDGLIGCASAYPRQVVFGAHTVRAGVLSDFAVKRAHRAAGAAVTVQRTIAQTAKEEGTALLYGYPNKASTPIFKRIGYKVVGEASDYIKPLRAGAYLERVIKPQVEKRAPALAPYLEGPALDSITAVGGVFADLAVGAAERLARYGLGFDLVFEDASRVDARYDALWQRARGQVAIEQPRDAAYLNWRYADFTTARYRFFSAASRSSGQVAGFVVYTVQNGWVNVADVFVESAVVHLDPLLAAFASAMRGEGHKAICIAHVGTRSLAPRLKRHGFIARPNGRFLMAQVLEGAPDELRAAALDLESWSMFDGELDI